MALSHRVIVLNARLNVGKQNKTKTNPQHLCFLKSSNNFIVNYWLVAVLELDSFIEVACIMNYY